MRDSATGQEMRRIDSLHERFLSMDESPVVNRIAVGSTSSLSIWDPESDTVTIRFHQPVSGDVRWSPDGQCLAAGCDDGIRLWDARRGYELGQTLGEHQR